MIVYMIDGVTWLSQILHCNKIYGDFYFSTTVNPTVYHLVIVNNLRRVIMSVFYTFYDGIFVIIY